MDILSKVIEVLEHYPLCDHCLGRLFGMLGTGLSNEVRGSSLKNVLFMKLHADLLQASSNEEKKLILDKLIILARSGHKEAIEFLKSRGIEVNPEKCYICRNELFEKIPNMLNQILEQLKNINIEFRTFKVGSTVSRDVLEREIEVVTKMQLNTAESIKRELNRLIGKELKKVLGKEVDKEFPDIVINVDFVKDSVNVEVMPWYIYLRYRKLVRGVSQVQLRLSVFTSVQKELQKLNELFNSDEIIIHAAGREDVDARMLGQGRPTIIQVVKPRRRVSFDELKSYVNNMNKTLIELVVDDVKEVKRRDVKKLKSEAQKRPKIYRVLVLLRQDVDDEKLKSLEQYFRNRQVTQYTPTRIKRKSPKKKRVRMVYEMKAIKLTNNLVELLIKCQGGLYVKELITGDYGRTNPNVSDVLGIEAIPIELDVLDVVEV